MKSNECFMSSDLLWHCLYQPGSVVVVGLEIGCVGEGSVGGSICCSVCSSVDGSVGDSVVGDSVEGSVLYTIVWLVTVLVEDLGLLVSFACVVDVMLVTFVVICTVPQLA